ncbi:hypothetical protein [Paenarthrobacter sp. DKR-5]|uniref:hypothetical protein n=1 Tax=Paenarthrobacter sp. DKR-5 TaxID=2835535 RepID=UPI0020288752|nr:hypothetical protein [Paenarthrobacter sp. DKR-5]
MLIGFLGFWAAVLLVVTLVAEFTGQPAIGWALLLLVLLLALWGLIRLRRTLPPRRAGRR